MATKSVRKLKVCAQIQLKRAWLRVFGFTENTPVTVQCETGRLVIKPCVIEEVQEPVMVVAENTSSYGKREKKANVR